MSKSGMRPIHPYEILREKLLEPLGMTARGLLKALHVTSARVNDIAHEKRGITPDLGGRCEPILVGKPRGQCRLDVLLNLIAAIWKMPYSWSVFAWPVFV